MNTLVALTARCVGVAALLCTGIGEASAQSMLTIRSPTGEERTFTEADSKFTLHGNGHFLAFTAGIDARLSESWWSIRLEAPEGETLRPGRYLNAGCITWARTGRLPGLEVTANNPVCKFPDGSDFVWGSFDIRQIAFDQDGKVTSIEATFVQRLETPNAPARTGMFRYNAAPLNFTVSAARGFPWGAISQSNHGDSSFFSLTGDTTGLVFEASVPRDQWRIRIAPPTGRLLAVGRYAALSAADANHAGLAVSRTVNDRTCLSTGDLNIEDVRVDTDGKISGLRASFLMRCSGFSTPLRGTIRYHL